MDELCLNFTTCEFVPHPFRTLNLGPYAQLYMDWDGQARTCILTLWIY